MSQLTFSKMNTNIETDIKQWVSEVVEFSSEYDTVFFLHFFNCVYIAAHAKLPTSLKIHFDHITDLSK